MSIEDLITETSFAKLKGKIDDRLLESLLEHGFERPTRIQFQVLPHMLLGRDLIGAAETGSGKTLAFLIPTIENLLKCGMKRKDGMGCLIISPARELSLQIYEVLKKLLTHIDLSHILLVGGEKKLKEVACLKKGVNIVVGTPGRLLDHIQNTTLFCGNLKHLILDEADKLLESGFEKHLTGILKKLPKKRQTALFSATIDEKVQNLARVALKPDATIVSVKNDKQPTATRLQQGYFLCPIEKRICWLYKMLKKCKKFKVMVFFSSCKSVDYHYEFFKVHCKAPVLSIHGKQSQPRRKETYQNFVDAEKGVLFCTDVAARGLDIPAVNWIIQFDPPTDIKDYIHRVGRTARGLSSVGNAVILLRPEEEVFIDYLKREKVYLDKYNFDEPSGEVQDMLENLISRDGTLKVLARKAYLSYLRCYKKHPLCKIFNIKNMDLKLAAKGFGFLEQPHVDFLKTTKHQKTKKEQSC
ncbi:ATP-dependent RNA helicase DDX18-like [Aricia agestis]|uniref:ATP-dependent RNA helicase DDX18-like n=1 Tax=Aricia agestis TaxID=91739 RepID=UPI001C2065AA|nr:ATP-dependent RNA helicase DDX18-like [Aricia agestis]